MKKSNRILLTVLLALAVILVVASFAAGNYMLGYALTPKPGDNPVHMSENAPKPAEDMFEWRDAMSETGAFRDTSIIVDGISLNAMYLRAPQDSRKTVICIHGYTATPGMMLEYARIFRDSLGYNVLMPALRYHGKSDGTAIQMGWLDRLDIEQWMTEAHNMFNDTLMVVHGVSMGGATTMMVSGEKLPGYVRGFIEDCGYSSVWEQFSLQLKDMGLPKFPIMHCASILCWLKYGWNFKEASSVDQLANCTLPMLFIHGDSDEVVPVEMAYANFAAKVNGYKELWIVPETTHAMSLRTHPDEYLSRVRTFLTEHVE